MKIRVSVVPIYKIKKTIRNIFLNKNAAPLRFISIEYIIYIPYVIYIFFLRKH